MKNAKAVAETCKSATLNGELTHRCTVRGGQKLQFLHLKGTDKVEQQQKQPSYCKLMSEQRNRKLYCFKTWGSSFITDILRYHYLGCKYARDQEAYSI